MDKNIFWTLINRARNPGVDSELGVANEVNLERLIKFTITECFLELDDIQHYSGDEWDQALESAQEKILEHFKLVMPIK